MERRIYEISNDELKKFICEIAEQLVNDLNFRVTEIELNYFINRMSEILPVDYKDIRLNSLKNINARLAAGTIELKKFSVSNYLRLLAEFKKENIPNTEKKEYYDYSEYNNASEQEKKARYFAQIAFIYRFNRGECGKGSPSFDDRVNQAKKGEIKMEEIKLDKDSIFNQKRW